MVIDIQKIEDIDAEQIAMIANATMSFLQKLAVRGDLISAEQGIALDRQLEHYKNMVNTNIANLTTIK
jgi:hypothetical protein